MLAYPFSSILETMKPCKPNPKTASHVQRMEEIMQSREYAFEEKIDGFSILSIGGRLFTNRVSKATGIPNEKTSHVPHITSELMQVSDKLILDGELYYPGKKSNHITSIANSDVPKAIERQHGGFLHQPGDSDALPNYVANRRSEVIRVGFLRYIVYDILRDIDGTWLITLPFSERRQILEKRVRNELAHIQELDLNKIHYDKFQERLDSIIDAGGEGGVLKSLNGVYHPGKRPMWNQVKLKQELEDDVVITGFEEPGRLYQGDNTDTWPFWEDGEAVTENYFRGLIGSVCIGKYDSHGEMVDMGRVTGLTDELRVDMTNNPHNYIGTVIKIKAMEKSEHGVYRHANYVEHHPDKNAYECKLDENDM